MNTDSWAFGLLLIWSVIAGAAIIACAVAMAIEASDYLSQRSARGYFKFMGLALIWPLTIVGFVLFGVMRGIQTAVKGDSY